MKVAFLAARYPPEIIGGGEISTQLIAEGLQKLGVDVVVICARWDGSVGEECISGVRVRTVPVANFYHYPPRRPVSHAKKLAWHLIDRNNPVMARRVSRILREESPALLHSHTLDGFSTSAWEAGRKLGIPVVHTLRSFYLLCVNAGMRKREANCESQCWSCKLMSAAKKAHSNQIQGVIGISQFILDQHLAAGYFSNATPKVIFNPVDGVSGISENTTSCRSGTQVNSGDHGKRKLKIGFLGRLHESKGLEPVLQQLRSFPDGICDFDIAGYGAPEYVAHLKLLAQDLPVRFLGKVDANEFLPTLDLLVVPSLWNEPFGRVTVEAFSFGVPVIGSRNGGTAELITEGKTGMFFDPLVPNSLQNAVQRFIDNDELLEQMKMNVLEEARSFTPEKIAESHLQFYKQLIETCSLQ